MTQKWCSCNFPPTTRQTIWRLASLQQEHHRGVLICLLCWRQYAMYAHLPKHVKRIQFGIVSPDDIVCISSNTSYWSFLSERCLSQRLWILQALQMDNLYLVVLWIPVWAPTVISNAWHVGLYMSVQGTLGILNLQNQYLALVFSTLWWWY